MSRKIAMNISSLKKTALLGLFALVVSGVILSKAPIASAAEERAPDFQATAIDGTKISLESFSGDALVLEWFNSNCPFVQRVYQQTSYLPDLHNEMKKRGVTWLVVNSTAKDHPDYLTPEKAKKVLSDWKIPDSLYIDDSSGELGKLFQMKTTPSFVIVDKVGMVAYRGAVDNLPALNDEEKGLHRYFENALREVLDKKKVTTKASEQYGCSIKYSR